MALTRKIHREYAEDAEKAALIPGDLGVLGGDIVGFC
jgi:hypothetical protein